MGTNGASENGSIIVEVDLLIKEIVPMYLREIRSKGQAISAALREDDFDSIRVIGHECKGSGGGYGFDTITEIGTLLEEAAQLDDSQEIERLAAELADYLDRVEVVYS